MRNLSILKDTILIQNVKAAEKMIYVFQKRQSTKNNVKVYGPVSNSSVLDNKEKNYFELVST